MAMQTEVDSLRENCAYEVATADELRSLNFRIILPMKMVVGVKTDANAGTSRRKARVVVCGNSQPKSAAEELHTASADITSARAALAAAVPKRWNLKVIDINTAFLNANLPESFETVFARPPQALIKFGLVPPGTVWKVLKAIYGLGTAPKAWGNERGREMDAYGNEGLLRVGG